MAQYEISFFLLKCTIRFFIFKFVKLLYTALIFSNKNHGLKNHFM